MSKIDSDLDNLPDQNEDSDNSFQEQEVRRIGDFLSRQRKNSDTDSDTDSDSEARIIGELLIRQEQLEERLSELEARIENPFVEKERQRAIQGQTTSYNSSLLNLSDIPENIDHPYSTTNEKKAMTPVKRGGKSKRKSKRKLRKYRKSRKIKNRL